jgi:hypothetical protein
MNHPFKYYAGVLHLMCNAATDMECMDNNNLRHCGRIDMWLEHANVWERPVLLIEI